MRIRYAAAAVMACAAIALPAFPASAAVCQIGSSAAVACLPLPRCAFHPICDELPWAERALVR